MRELVTRHPCACPVEEFWGLREDPGWDIYNAQLDGQIFTELTREVKIDPKNGEETIVRSHQLKAKSNPIPKALRGMLGSDEFKFVVQAQWYRLKYSQVCAMRPEQMSVTRGCAAAAARSTRTPPRHACHTCVTRRRSRFRRRRR